MIDFFYHFREYERLKDEQERLKRRQLELEALRNRQIAELDSQRRNGIDNKPSQHDTDNNNITNKYEADFTQYLSLSGNNNQKNNSMQHSKSDSQLNDQFDNYNDKSEGNEGTAGASNNSNKRGSVFYDSNENPSLKSKISLSNFEKITNETNDSSQSQSIRNKSLSNQGNQDYKNRNNLRYGQQVNGENDEEFLDDLSPSEMEAYQTLYVNGQTMFATLSSLNNDNNNNDLLKIRIK
jgi:hypothetical protein